MQSLSCCNFREDDVISHTIILYFQYIYTELYFSYLNGITAVFSYKFGYNDTTRLHCIFIQKQSGAFALSSFVKTSLLYLTVKDALTNFTSTHSSAFMRYSMVFMIWKWAYLYLQCLMYFQMAEKQRFYPFSSFIIYYAFFALSKHLIIIIFFH